MAIPSHITGSKIGFLGERVMNDARDESFNRAILREYLLAPVRSREYLVALYTEPGVSVHVDMADFKGYVVAVYVATGRGPFKYDASGTEGWEYRYVGVRVRA